MGILQKSILETFAGGCIFAMFMLLLFWASEKWAKKERKMKLRDDQLICTKCLVADHFFRGGGSWAPDSCPHCNNTLCTTAKFLKRKDRKRADKLWTHMWRMYHKEKAA